MAMIKTTSGSWCTSRRFHEQTRLKCIVGCEAPDSWMHYLHCTKFWSLVSNITDTPRAASPLERLGIFPINLGEMAKVLIMYTVYHEIKIGNAVSTAEEQANSCIDYKKIKEAANLAYKALRWNSKAHVREALELQRRTPRRPRTS